MHETTPKQHRNESCEYAICELTNPQSYCGEHFEVRRGPNPLFTGREDELGRLREALCPSESWSEETSRPKIYVIQGMGGAGKSEVAVKFAHDNRPK